MTGTARIYIFTQVLALAALVAVIKLELLGAMLAGLLVYQIVDFGARRLGRIGVIPVVGKSLLLFFVAIVVVSAFGLCMYTFASHVAGNGKAGSFAALLQRMADVVDAGRGYMPEWMQQYLPANIDEWQVAASDWLRENARNLSVIGRDVGRFLVHLILGMIIGGMMALSPPFQERGGPFAQAVSDRLDFLSVAFRRIVFSQIRISALNTFLTGVYLMGILPILLGHPLPLTKTLVVLTFLAGLLPVIGNLISNTAIFLISLSVSPLAAVGSLAFLIIIHKLEYFMNARIIGGQIRARAWEILLAMIVMEAAFGVPGVVAAPIYYAYLKDELSAQKLI